jgi:GNAT superfamily N-acetyltransferase
MPQYKIRLADFEDAERIVELCNCGMADTEFYSGGLVKIDDVEEFLVEDIDSCALFLLCYNEAPVGFIAGVVSGHPVFNNSKAVAEWFWYVLPEHRLQKQSLKLIKAYENWARKIGARFVAMSHFHDDAGSRLSKVYERMGYKPIEHTYYKELN